MGLEWGDSYKRADALGFTISGDASYHSSRLAPSPTSSYNIMEELFETDEDICFEMIGKGNQVGGSVYSTYEPSQQISLFNLPTIGEDDDNEINFPSYDGADCCNKVELVESATKNTPATENPVSPDPVERPEDDTAIRVQPSRHVDYLSHDWDEEDIWASWKHIVSNRGAYKNFARLENASWRSWEKKRSNLRTVPPETVKWMKDYDLTWLYGPLMPGPRALGEESYSSTRQGRRMSRAEIARHSKKPILKKRSPSEIMLRQSIFSSLLLKQAVASKLGKESSQLPYPIETPTRSDTNTPSSKSTDGLATPDGWKKVQFHELVEQCIVLANAGDEEHEYHYNCDSDDDVIPMWEAKKRATNKWLLAVKPKILPQAAKTIEKLPNAPLKDDEALEDTTEEESIEGTSSPTSISNKSVLLSLDSDEEDDIDWQPPAWLQGRKDSVQIMKDRLANFNMQQDDRAKENTVSHRAYVERRDAGKVEDELPHAQMALSSQGSDALIRFEPAPTRSQLTSFSFSTSKDQFPREDYFIVDPGMTEGESEDSSDMIRSSSHSSESSDKSDSPGLALDNFQQTLLDRVMAEFWRLFYQQRETYLSQSTDSSPPSPTGLTSVPHLMRGRHKSGLPHSRHQQQRGADKLKPYFENSPAEIPASPDSLELAHYESYIHRQLPRLVRQSIEEAVRRDVRPTEASLIKSLVSVIHDCQDRIFQAYIEMTDREDSIRALGIRSKDPFRSSTLSKDTEHQHSLLLDAAFQQPPSQEMGSNRPSLRSSLLSSSPHSASVTPITPSEMVFSGSSASDITSSCSTPSHVGSDLNKYSLLRDMRDEHLRSVNKLNLFEYDELDEALAWSQVY